MSVSQDHVPGSTWAGVAATVFGALAWSAVVYEALLPSCGVNFGLGFLLIAAPLFLLLAVVSTVGGAEELRRRSGRSRFPLIWGLVGLVLCGGLVFAATPVWDAIEHLVQIAGANPNPAC